MQLIAQVLQALELAYVYSQSSYIVVGQKAPFHDKLSLQPWKISLHFYRQYGVTNLGLAIHAWSVCSDLIFHW